MRKLVEQTIDQLTINYAKSDVPHIIAAAAMNGRLEDALGLLQHYQKDLTIPEIVLARFFIGVTHCRYHNYRKAHLAFYDNWLVRHQLKDHCALFNIYQGWGFFRYTYGFVIKAEAWAQRAEQIAMANHFVFGRAWAGDLLSHIHLARGSVQRGLKKIVDISSYAEKFKYRHIAEACRVSHLLYQSNLVCWDLKP